MPEGGMSQEEIDKLLKGLSNEENNNESKKEENQTDNDSSGKMSQEEIDKLLNGFSNDNNTESQTEGRPIEDASGAMSQEEIDKLLSGHLNNDNKSDSLIEKSQTELIVEEKKRRNDNLLSQEERDVVGEIGNIAFGSASTALSSILNQKVEITTPVVDIIDENEMGNGDVSHVILNVNFVTGLEMENVFVIEEPVALYIADLMMMGTGEIEEGRILDEIELSAVQEAMNQMMGMAATAMSEIFHELVDISPPTIQRVDINSEVERIRSNDKKVVRISFNLEIGEKIQSKLYQIVSINNAKTMASRLLSIMNQAEEKEEYGGIVDDSSDELIKEKQEISKQELKRNNKDGLNPLIQNVEVKLELVYGKTKKTLKDFLSLERNHIVELKEEMHEPLSLYANGVLVAEGYLVNIDGFYGVKIQKII